MNPVRALALAFLPWIFPSGAPGFAESQPQPEATPHVTLLADLSPEVLRAAQGEGGAPTPSSDAWEILGRIFAAAPPYHFDAGLVGVDTDRRWFQTLPPGDAAAPILELRRWPGDSVLALYALEGESPSAGDPPVPGSRLTFMKKEAAADVWRWEGILSTAMGPRPVVWIERRIAGIPRRLAALLIPGDAGLGRAAVADLLRELLAVLARVEVRPDAWSVQEGIQVGTAVVLPALDSPPSDADERRDAWQVVDGKGFTLGLPPGVRARRMELGLLPPRPVPAALLWIRGRFLDRRGERVAIGDGTRAGYLAAISSLDRAWAFGEKPPLGAPTAKLVVGEDASLPCEQTGADGARAERWTEPGFPGQWLVFRLVFGGAGVEIGLPVLSGRQSETLFWIPTTLRGSGSPPAPPPVDPAERFGISFEQFTKLEQKRHPGFEGVLTVPGARFELPKGWFPVTTLRSEDGFPITLLDGRGRAVARLERVPAGAAELARPVEGGEWIAVTRPTARKRTAVYRREDGARLFATAAGHGVRLIPQMPGLAAQVEWARLVESATLPRTRTRKAAADGE